MTSAELKSIWNSIVECEQRGIEQPEFYKPGIPWIWWVEMVNCYAGN